MEGFKRFSRKISLFSIILAISITPIYGQISTPCTASMITSFTPCMNFVTGSTANGSSPNSDCCDSLKSLLSGSTDCACLIITANVPVQLPINRTLAISLPRACNMGGVPLQCKSSGAPLPPPGSLPFGPAPSPSDISPSPRASFVPESTSPAPSPESDTKVLAPSPVSPPLSSEVPTSIPGRRPVLTPSSVARLSHISSPFMFMLGIMILMCY